MKRNKRLVVLADTHCGHLAGLTPPDWWYDFHTTNPKIQAVYQQQQQMWKWFTERIDALKPIDYCFHLGDCVDGKGSRTGGTEQRTADYEEQAQMAAKIINYVHAPRNLLIYGTPYHVGQEDDEEKCILPLLKGKSSIESHAFVDINGIVFDLKHFISSSSVPHTRWTALARSKLWNIVWHNEHDLQPDANVLIRAHIHYHVQMSENDSWRAMTCPALIGFGSKYGKRLCEGIVHIGFLVFDFPPEGGYIWHPELLRLELHKVQLLKW